MNEDAADRRDDGDEESTLDAPHPDTAKTMQHEHEEVPGRQRYDNARPGDYSRDFEADGSGSHPVKAGEGEGVDENGIPDIAETEPSDTEAASKASRED